MTLDEAKIILADYVTDEGLEYKSGEYLHYPGLPHVKKATLDGDFTADQLEAVAVFMRASQTPSEYELSEATFESFPTHCSFCNTARDKIVFRGVAAICLLCIRDLYAYYDLKPL